VNRNPAIIAAVFLFSMLVLGYAAFGFWTMLIFTSGFLGGGAVAVLSCQSLLRRNQDALLSGTGTLRSPSYRGVFNGFFLTGWQRSPA